MIARLPAPEVIKVFFPPLACMEVRVVSASKVLAWIVLLPPETTRAVFFIARTPLAVILLLPPEAVIVLEVELSKERLVDEVMMLVPPEDA